MEPLDNNPQWTSGPHRVTATWGWKFTQTEQTDLTLIAMDLIESDVEHNDLSQARSMLASIGIAL